jgi:hypothetical protein
MKPEDQKVTAHQRLQRVFSAIWLLLAVFVGWKIFADCQRIEGLGLKPINWGFQVMPSLVLACAAGWILCRRAAMYWVLSLSLIAATFLSMIAFFGNGMAETTGSVTDPEQYHRTLNDYWRSGAPDIVAHFPERIPADAQNIHFLFTPRFLMGGARLYLLFQTSAEEIQRIRNVAEKLRNSGCNLLGNTAGITEINQFPKPIDPSAPTLGDELSADFNLYFFDATFPEMRLEEWCWNRGITHGIAINEKSQQVLFWADYW